MSMSNIVENNMLNYILNTAGGETGVIRPNPPEIVYIALFTDPDGLTSSSLETNAGTGVTIPYELAGGNYSRQRIRFQNPAVGGQIANSSEVIFPLATSDWGLITHYALLNLGVTDIPGTLFWGVFDTPQFIENSDRFVIRTGQLKVRMN
jgi:hypothetical protein